jgi:hypothetical protein
MVESVASGALDMLKASRSPIVPAPEPAGVKKPVPVLLTAADLLPTRIVADTAPAQTMAEVNAVSGDSGDEQPTPIIEPAPPLAPVAEPPVSAATPVPPAAPMWRTAPERIAAAAVADFKAVEAEIAAVPEAVNRMLHHSSASSTAIRAPVDLTMHVEHNDEGLPMFLRRGTTFEAMTNNTGRPALSRMSKPTALSFVDSVKRHFLPRRPVDVALPVDPGGLPMFLRRDTVFARAADAA